jgi:hypothetical protein
MEKLSRAFETKLAGLKAAHELAQQQLIAEADLRHSIHTTDQASKRAMQDASQLSVMQGIQILGGYNRLSSSPSHLSIRIRMSCECVLRFVL